MADLTIYIRKIVPNADGIAFEVTMIDRIVANSCGEKPDICFGQTVANKIIFAFEHLLQPPERGVQCLDVFKVSFLFAGDLVVVREIGSVTRGLRVLGDTI